MHHYVLRKLESAKGRWREVARGSGVPRRTVEKIARKEHPDPRVSSVQALHDFFVDEERRKRRRRARNRH
jgi:galactose mutarotase-like enzyme